MSKSPDLRALVAQHGTPLLLVDCDVVRRQYRALHEALPNVTLYYALKPLPNAAVVAELRDLGACFDLATAGEIKLVKAAGVPPERCIHTHPIKSDAEIAAALRFGIRTFVADNPDELRKFVRHRRRAEILLRLSFRDPTAVVDLSRKFGCEPAAVLPMLELARSLGVRVRGLSFHVGSQVAEPRKYVEAIGVCADLIDAARQQGLAELDVVDIGGGFPIPYRGETAADRAFLPPDPAGAAQAAEARARHRRTGSFHRRPGGNGRRPRHRPRTARRALVVLPRRRHVRLLQRPALRPRALSGRGARARWPGPPERACRARPATAST